MLATIGFIVVMLWLVGLLTHVAGGFIHLLLVIGAIMLIAHFMRGRPHTV